MRCHAQPPLAGTVETIGVLRRTGFIFGMVGIAVMLLGLAVAASPARAVDQTYVQDGESFASGPGAGAGELDHPRRIAIDEGSGDIFVADRDNDRIVVFRAGVDPAATYLTDFGSAMLDAPFGVAIDQASGAVYVTSPGNDQIVKFVSDGAPTPIFTVDPTFTSPALGSGAAEIGDFEADIAVEPTSGDLLVADPGNNLVKRFSSSGAHKANFDGSSSEGGVFTGLLDLDVAPSGDVYVIDATGPLVEEGQPEGGGGPCERNYYCYTEHTSRTLRFASDGSNGQTLIAPGVDAYGLVSFDASNTQVMVAGLNPQRGSVDAYRFDGSGPVARFSPPNFGFSPITGIAVDAGSPRAYVVTDRIPHTNFNEEVGQVAAVAYRPVNYPSVVGSVEVSEVTSDSAHVEGSVNPNGEPTKARFEYLRAGDLEWRQLPEQEIGSASSPVFLEADIRDLAPNSEYLVRLVARNEAGAQATSPEASFNTIAIAPSVVTGGVAPRTQTTARLNGWVNPNSAETTFQFEYGPTTSYGTTLPVTPGEVGSGGEPIAVATHIESLAPGTAYHFRLVATNATGTTIGADQVFVTRTAAEAGPRRRGLELVNNPDKGNSPAKPVYSGVSLASPDGSRILWSVTAGAPGGSTGSGNTFLAERTPAGWRSRSLLPAADQLVGKGELSYQPLIAAPGFNEFLYMASTDRSLTVSSRTYLSMDLDYNQRLLGTTGPLISTDGLTSETTVERASDDFAHLYTNVRERHDPAHPEATTQIYDFGSGSPELASLLPNDTPPDCGVRTTGNLREWASGGYEWASTAAGGPARLFFLTRGELPCGETSKLYVRDLDAGVTTLISGPALPGGPQDEAGTFIRASDDGSTVLFATAARLAPGDHNDVGDIYRYTLGGDRECLTCVGPGADTGVVLEGGSFVVSNDLSRIYFVGNNVLVPGAGQKGVSNLYLWRDGEIEYVAPLGTEGLAPESAELAEGDEVLFFRSNDSQISTDVTGGHSQVYRYDEDDRSIECVTCVAGHTPTAEPKPALATILPLGGIGASAERGDAYVFQTSDPIDPRDVNGGQDIYEWRNGQVGLVTDGVTQYPPGLTELQLLAIGNDGLNVMFTAGVNFTGYERDNVGQYYVARVGGGFPRPPGEPAPCGEESCQGPLPPPPSPLAPGSAGFEGPGNVKEAKKRCVRKGKAKSRKNRKGRCVKRTASRSEKKRGNR